MEPVDILPNIESPRALRLAADIARASPRVVGLQAGWGDLIEPLDIDRYNPAMIEALQLQIRIAAGEAGIWAYDGAYANIKDPERLRREAEGARRLGYVGKSAIHPTQVPVANAVFRPTDAEIAHSLKVVEAAQVAAAKGIGAFTVNGRMVDGPFVRRAEAILESRAQARADRASREGRMKRVAHAAGVARVGPACDRAAPVSLEAGDDRGALSARRLERHLRARARQAALGCLEDSGARRNNRAGAGGSIGAGAVSSAAPDGYTLCLLSSSFTTNAAIQTNLPFDPIASFTPVGMVARGPMLLTVANKLPVKTTLELFDYARRNPGQAQLRHRRARAAPTTSPRSC